jgi:hypothetical protein
MGVGAAYRTWTAPVRETVTIFFVHGKKQSAKTRHGHIEVTGAVACGEGVSQICELACSM